MKNDRRTLVLWSLILITVGAAVAFYFADSSQRVKIIIGWGSFLVNLGSPGATRVIMKRIGNDDTDDPKPAEIVIKIKREWMKDSGALSLANIYAQMVATISSIFVLLITSLILMYVRKDQWSFGGLLLVVGLLVWLVVADFDKIKWELYEEVAGKKDKIRLPPGTRLTFIRIVAGLAAPALLLLS